MKANTKQADFCIYKETTHRSPKGLLAPSRQPSAGWPVSFSFSFFFVLPSLTMYQTSIPSLELYLLEAPRSPILRAPCSPLNVPSPPILLLQYLDNLQPIGDPFSSARFFMRHPSPAKSLEKKYITRSRATKHP